MDVALTVASAAFACCAVLDWYAVARHRRSLEYVFKPAAMVFLIGVAVSVDAVDATTQAWFVAALILSLAGDIFLMLPRNLFVPGLVAFLFAHLAYVVGFVVRGVEPTGLAVGAVLVVVALVSLGRHIVRAVRQSEEPGLTAPVVVYIGVISAMVMAAVGTLEPAAIAGAGLFYASDALIAWNRFIDEYPWGRVAIMVTYHLGQFALVLSLTT